MNNLNITDNIFYQQFNNITRITHESGRRQAADRVVLSGVITRQVQKGHLKT